MVAFGEKFNYYSIMIPVSCPGVKNSRLRDIKLLTEITDIVTQVVPSGAVSLPSKPMPSTYRVKSCLM